MMRWISLIGAIGIGLGFYLAGIGFQQWTVYKAFQTAPEEISLKELVRERDLNGGHITLKDYILGANVLVRSAGTGPAKGFAPAGPTLGPSAQAGNQLTEFDVMVVAECKDEADFLKRINQQSLQGLVINKLAPLTPEEMKALESNYPEAKISKCLFIQVGKTPVLLQLVVAQLGSGGLLVLLGIGAVWFGIRRSMIEE